MASDTSFRPLLSRAAAATVIALVCARAHAAPQTYHFTGVISHFGFTNGPIGDVQIGDSFSGSFTLDTSASPIPPLSVNPGFQAAQYDSVSDITATIRGHTIRSATQPGVRDITIGNGDPGISDSLELSTYNYRPFSPYNGGSHFSCVYGLCTPYYLELDLVDSNGRAFSSTSLPQTLSLSSFDSSTFYFNWLVNSYSQVYAAGSLLTLTPVPEPGAPLLALLGIGLVWLVRITEKRPRKT